MSDTEKDNNIQSENTENPTENELPKNEENTTEEPIKLKKSGKSRKKTKKNKFHVLNVFEFRNLVLVNI